MTVDQRPLTPLQDAVTRHDAARMRQLLDDGADVSESGRLAWTALHWAAYGHDPEAARMLVERGAPIDARDVAGNTPLLCAMVDAYWFGAAKQAAAVVQTVTLLLSARADPLAANQAGTTPRSFASSPGLARRVAAQFEPDDGPPPPRVAVARSTPHYLDLEIDGRGLHLSGDYVVMPHGKTDRVLQGGSLDRWSDGEREPLDPALREYVRCCLIATGNLLE
ncbi:MAG TPA: ankyrin repeat domain-containing protein [Actinocrinis sp.]|nr:ankyrin repeat domain-containing protein [Actinocrinis sp.]